MPMPMPMPILKTPEDIRTQLKVRFNNQHPAWLLGGGTWPLQFPLGAPSEAQIAADVTAVRAWIAAWESSANLPGEVVWTERQWARIGRQNIPTSVCFGSAASVARALGHEGRWTLAMERAQTLLAVWPQLDGLLGRQLPVLADYPVPDFTRLVSLLRWAEANPKSDMYLRQLPVEGLDTKWIEQRTGVVRAFVSALRGGVEAGDLYDLLGLRKDAAHWVRMKILCPNLRAQMGGMTDVQLPVVQLSTLSIQPGKVVIVENLETGLALPDMPSTVAIIGMGNAVTALSGVPWLHQADCVYWGDIDTHGYLMLDRARRAIPRLRSVLMDHATLLSAQFLWGTEPTHAKAGEFPFLEPSEREVCEGLLSQTWGLNIRLEQERLPWSLALQALQSAL
jgi:hypothetical protein